MNKFDYTEFDKIVKGNLSITLDEFKTKYPEIKVSTDQFYSRRAALKGTPYKNKMHLDLRESGKSKISSNKDIKTLVTEYKPASKYVDEFIRLIPILTKTPTVTHKELNDAKVITMSDADFYQFRKFFVKAINSDEKSIGRIKRAYNRKMPLDGDVRHYNRLYHTIMEISKYPKGAEKLLQDIFLVLNKSSVCRENIELIEKSLPNKCLEIRTYPRR